MSSPNPSPSDPAADPAPKSTRRRFSDDYRARTVAEYRAAPHGEKSAVLRREGLHQSQIREWATSLDNTSSNSSAATDNPKSRNRTGSVDRKELDRLTRANAQLQKQLAQTEAALEIMGKLQVLLESISESTGTPVPPTTP